MAVEVNSRSAGEREGGFYLSRAGFGLNLLHLGGPPPQVVVHDLDLPGLPHRRRAGGTQGKKWRRLLGMRIFPCPKAGGWRSNRSGRGLWVGGGGGRAGPPPYRSSRSKTPGIPSSPSWRSFSAGSLPTTSTGVSRG